ncbi:cupin domain-containing protein [Rudaeicoccus suwonensis]|uniref:Cupin domain n=1 Tax=Rudaeicoccus suwonensis TaxID=657409 RepID=A0A561E382_9MICO|nr:cupin domain-containing protein [Rudaeicoccus suwonensis]TWE10059.1 cupin domain [Rudaeicoccus suwonensis]
MNFDFSDYQLEGDPSAWVSEDGILRPVVTRAGEEDGRTMNSGGAVRMSGVSIQHTPARRLWFGKVQNDPGFRSGIHHHGEAETGGYVLSGRARIYYGNDFADHLDMEEGDWVFVPPFLPHIECNMSTTQELVWMTTRTPENLVVNIGDVDDSMLPGFRRA